MKTQLPFYYLVLLIAIGTACGETSVADHSATEELESATAPLEKESVTAASSKTEPTSRSIADDPIAEKEDDESENGPIATIRENYADLKAKMDQGALREEIKEFTCESGPGGGELIRYYDGKELVVMQLSEGGEHSWETTTIYLRDGQPFFVFVEEGYWQFGGPYNEESPNTIDQIKETRYYLQDGVILQQLTKSFENKSWEDSPESSEVLNELVDIPAGTQYPGMAAIPQIKRGNVGC